MCGIVGYIGYKEAQPILIEGLRRLEYRGYDSAGITVVEGSQLNTCRAAGCVADLEAVLGDFTGVVGIAHTRWATHGKPSEQNAHPHCDADGRIAIVHNGIIENHHTLRVFLEEQGVVFRSETDTEVLPHLIRYFYKGNLPDAVRNALLKVEGTFGVVVASADHPDMLVAAKRGSPLIIGVGEGEFIVASDASAIVEHTVRAVYLVDNEICTITLDGFSTTTLDAAPVSKEVQEIELKLEQIELGGHKHYMMKEIVEQPDALRTCLLGRLNIAEGQVVLGGIHSHLCELRQARRIILTACGTAWHAGLIGEYLFEDLVRVPAKAEYASEFRYRNPVVDEGTVVVAISQSGETADTISALREARARGALALGVVNVVGSTISRGTDAGVYIHVGPEIGVASTKAFTGQVAVLLMLAIHLGRKTHVSASRASDILSALDRVPDQITRMLEQSDAIRVAAEAYISQDNWLYLGRGYNYPVALEGALKLKEISYIHAEGMPAAEMKHGPIALISDGMPAVFIATQGSQYDKILSNIEEVRSRGGHVIAVATEGDDQIASLAEHVFWVPEAPECVQPLLTVVPLQLLAYHAAVLRGCDVDKPRNLAKSVTVE